MLQPPYPWWELSSARIVRLPTFWLVSSSTTQVRFTYKKWGFNITILNFCNKQQWQPTFLFYLSLSFLEVQLWLCNFAQTGWGPQHWQHWQWCNVWLQVKGYRSMRQLSTSFWHHCWVWSTLCHHPSMVGHLPMTVLIVCCISRQIHFVVEIQVQAYFKFAKVVCLRLVVFFHKKWACRWPIQCWTNFQKIATSCHVWLKVDFISAK